MPIDFALVHALLSLPLALFVGRLMMPTKHLAGE